MMYSNPLYFSEKFEKGVKFCVEDDECRGTLKLRPGRMPELTVDPGVITPDLAIPDPFICRVGSTSYHLYDSWRFFGGLNPSSIVVGNIGLGEFKAFRVLLSGFSHWFLRQRNLADICDSEVIIPRCTENFEITVSGQSGTYKVSSQASLQMGNAKGHKGQATLLEEQALINIERLDGTFKVSDVEHLSSLLRATFTIVLGVYVEIEALWVDANGGDQHLPMYTINTNKGLEPFDSVNECVLQAQTVHSQGAWECLFRFLQGGDAAESYRRVWGRLVGLAGFSGVWEHQLLGYVSTFESYCTAFVEENGVKLSKSITKKLSKKLKDVVENFREEISADETQSLLLDGVKQTNCCVRPVSLSLQQKFSMVSKEMPDIMEIIGFTKDEFKHLKKVRDDIAHGSPPRTKSSDDELTYESILQQKLRLLLTYLFFKECGFRDDVFLTSIRFTLNKMVRFVKPNRELLDRACEDIDFFKVSPSDMSKLQGMTPRFYLVFSLHADKETLILEESLSDHSQAWGKGENNGFDGVEEFLGSKEPASTFRYKSRIYVECSGQCLPIDACLIKLPKT